MGKAARILNEMGRKAESNLRTCSSFVRRRRKLVWRELTGVDFDVIHEVGQRIPARKTVSDYGTSRFWIG